MNATETRNPAGSQDIAASVKEVTQATKQMFEAGQRMTVNLENLERRVEYATDWKARLAERPWLVVAGAVIGGFVLWRIFHD